MIDTEVLIIGGGISGLSVAAHLARHDVPVEVWERAARPGGKIKSQRRDGYLTEQAANLLVNFRPEVDQLIQATGLDHRKQRRNPASAAHRYLLNNGRLQRVPMSLPGMALSSLWSGRGKLRLLAEALVPRGGGEEETVSQFIRRRLGPEMLEKAIEPFISGTLAADPDQANAWATLPRLTALERRYGSLTMGALIGRLSHRRRVKCSESFSFAGGMATLVEALAATPGLSLSTGRSALELVREGKHWRVTGQSAEGTHTVRARHVVLSTPADVSARLVTPLDNELGEALATLPYAPLSVVHLGLDRDDIDHPLDGTGFLVPRNEQRILTGNLWMSRLFADRAPDGKVLLTSYIGGSRRPETIHWSDEQLLDGLLADLEPLLGIRGGPDFLHIVRHRRALPLYHGAYQGRLRAMDQGLERLPGLHLAANYRGGVSVRDRIVCGYQTAGHILEERAEKASRSAVLSPTLGSSHGTLIDVPK